MVGGQLFSHLKEKVSYTFHWHFSSLQAEMVLYESDFVSFQFYTEQFFLSDRQMQSCSMNRNYLLLIFISSLSSNKITLALTLWKLAEYTHCISYIHLIDTKQII